MSADSHHTGFGNPVGDIRVTSHASKGGGPFVSVSPATATSMFTVSLYLSPSEARSLAKELEAAAVRAERNFTLLEKIGGAT